MTKKLIFIIVLGIVLMGCKAKKKPAYTGRSISKAKVVSKETNTKKYLGDGLHTLPEDSGIFVRFEVSSVAEYIDTFSEIAQFEMKAYGIPASITLAQGLLESGLGRGELAMKTNNHFGIKCHTGWQGDFDYHDDDKKGECFRKYNHPRYSFRDHSIFLSSRSRYAFLFDLREDDYKRWAKGLRQAGYATDKRYPQKLISLIEQHRLYKYDRAVIKRRPDAPKESVVVENTHTVQKGDTLYSISRRYLVSVDELKRLNRMRGNIISIGQELTLKSQKFNK